MSELASRARKPFTKKPRETTTLRDLLVGRPGDPKELDEAQIAGVRAEAALARNYNAELAEYANQKAAIAAAQKRADDELLRKVQGR